jgi:phosphotransferase system enzyme I (PtsI)
MTTTYAGLGVSAGVAAGPVARVALPPPPEPGDAPVGDPAAETERALEALEAVAAELEDLARRTGASGSMLVKQARIAHDPSLAGVVQQLVRAGRSAARAVYEGMSAYRDMRAADPLRPAPPAAELDDLRSRAVARLLGQPTPGVPDGHEPLVLVARDLSPAVTATLDPARVVAIVTERGGPTSHTAVVARALGIPAVVACAGAAALLDGRRIVVDGTRGVVTADPEPGEFGDAVRQRSRRADAAASAPVGGPAGPGATRDGRPVALVAAVGGPGDVADALAVGAEGVGVFRTEFLFLDRAMAPGMREQSEAYRAVFDAFPDRVVTVRTLDVGADKPLSFVRLTDEDNPALGLRGLRVARREPALLDTQLDAIARAAERSKAKVRVMAPMVATHSEAAWFAARCRAHGIDDAGVMVEVPAAALRAGDLLEVVDFLSIGTNDLAQYTVAADRSQGQLADLLDPWQPALLDLIAMVLRTGQDRQSPVTVCGEAPGDPLLALVFVGLGAAGLSMTPSDLPEVRASVAAHTYDECRELAELALRAPSAEEARGRVADRLRG